MYPLNGCIKKHKLKQYFVVIVFFLHLLNVQWWKYEYKLQSKLQYYQCQSFATNCHSSDHTSFQCFHFRSTWYFSSPFFCIKQKHVLSLKRNSCQAARYLHDPVLIQSSFGMIKLVDLVIMFCIWVITVKPTKLHYRS